MRAFNGFAAAPRSYELKARARFCISDGCSANALNSNGRVRQSVGRERNSWRNCRRGSQPAGGASARRRVNPMLATVTTAAGQWISRRRIPCLATSGCSILASVESQKTKLSP